MEYHHVSPTGDKSVVHFYHSHYPKVFEKSFGDDQFFLTEEVKSWLVQNDIKVFVKYEENEVGTLFKVQFQTTQDAADFMTRWARWGEDD